MSTKIRIEIVPVPPTVNGFALVTGGKGSSQIPYPATGLNTNTITGKGGIGVNWSLT